MTFLKTERMQAAVFAALLLAFCGRVAAQLLQKFAPVAWLPGFEHWQSGLLPYAALVFFQALIILGCVTFLLKIASGTLLRRPARGKILLILGSVYFTGAVLRLALSQTGWLDSHFFKSPIAATFHVVLALMVLIWSGFHRRTSAKDAAPA